MAEAFILLTYFTFSLLSLFQSQLCFDSNKTCYAFRTCTRKAFTKLLLFGVHYIKKYNILTQKILTMEIKCFILYGTTLFGVRNMVLLQLKIQLAFNSSIYFITCILNKYLIFANYLKRQMFVIIWFPVKFSAHNIRVIETILLRYSM